MAEQRSHQITVYCHKMEKRMGRQGGSYLKEQRKIADEMLNYGLKKQFDIEAYQGKGYGEHGKPYLLGVSGCHYNVSHTDGMVVCALGDISMGVDAERIRNIRESVIRKCCTREEQEYIEGDETGHAEKNQRFFQIWTLKESYIKMTGEGMAIPLTETGFWIKEPEIRCSRGGTFCQRREGEYWISLCTEKEAEVFWVEIKEEL